MTKDRLLDAYRAFAIDLDGVVWRESEAVDGAAEGIAELRRGNKRVLFLTNNAAYTPESVVKRLQRQGILAEDSEVLTSGMVAQTWIAENGLVGAPAFVLGPPEVVAQLSASVQIVELERGVDVALVIVGRDLSFSFERLAVVAAAVRSGARLVGVNRDPTMPTARGLEPGTGAILAAIETASGADAVVLGKPQPPMMEAAAAILGRKGVLMIGDRPATDVAGARLVGWDAALVLSGVTSADEPPVPTPDYLLRSLRDLSSEAVAVTATNPAPAS